MEWLNYHHLLYFWVVAKQGSIVGAAKELRLAEPTISGQVHRLEAVLGEKLFRRKGRALVLTDPGQVAYRYADEIFSLGREFLGALKGKGGSRPLRFVVGVADVLPPSLVRRVLEPAFDLGQPVQIVCRADRSVAQFVAELALHRIDVVIADRPVESGSRVRAFSHLLGECGTTFFAAPTLARSLRRGFPQSLEDAPLLLPGSSSMARRTLEEWLDRLGLRPNVVGEFDDSAVAKDFGEYGLGVFMVPSVIEREVLDHYAVEVVGRASDVSQRFYAISIERRIKHPAVAAVCEVTRRNIFKANGGRPKQRRRRSN